MKATIQNIIKYIKSSLPWAWKFLIRAARYPTGRRLLALAIVAAASALGLNWPFEQVQEAVNIVIQGIGVDGTVSLEAIIGGVGGAILMDGMFRANDTAKDAKRLVMPNRMYVADMADPAPSVTTKIIEGANRKVAYYEIRDGVLYAVAEDGASRDLSMCMRESSAAGSKLLAIYEYLKART